MSTRKIRTNLPEIGTIVFKKYKGLTVQAKIVEVNKAYGKVALEMDGVIYDSPTAAAKKISGNEVNGWVFWKLDNEPTQTPNI
jgi:hypothetical protein